jgi:TonB family protein
MYPRGLTSNRHAGRPDRWSIRAFALAETLPTTTAMFNDARKPKVDPRSPVQPGRSSAPYFVAAVIGAVMIWTAQQYWSSDSRPENRKKTPRREASTQPAAARGEVRTLFSGDDYPALAAANNEQGTAQAKLTVDSDGRVSHCAIVRSSGYEILDSATCSILQKRARFTPARDADGRPVQSTIVTPPIRWQLEG